MYLIMFADSSPFPTGSMAYCAFGIQKLIAVGLDLLVSVLIVSETFPKPRLSSKFSAALYASFCHNFFSNFNSSTPLRSYLFILCQSKQNVISLTT